jgi:hypothetical protein
MRTVVGEPAVLGVCPYIAVVIVPLMMGYVPNYVQCIVQASCAPSTPKGRDSVCIQAYPMGVTYTFHVPHSPWL